MQFSLNITSAFLRRSHARRIFHHWPRLTLAVVLVLTAIGFEVRRGEFGRVAVFCVAALGFVVLVYALAWFRQAKAIDDWVKRQGGEPVVYTLNEATVEATAQVGSASLKWDAFTKLKISDLDVLLVVKQHNALTLPTPQVPPDALEFLIQRFSRLGKKIEDHRSKP